MLEFGTLNEKMQAVCYSSKGVGNSGGIEVKMTANKLIFDSDLHPVPVHQLVAEYLDEPWRSRYLRGDHGAGHPNYFNPNGVMRSDSVTEEGVRIEKSPETMASHYMDVYDIDYAVLNPMEAMEHCVSPDAHYSAAALSAVNTHFVEDWLPVDERYLASITIAFSNIELAVQEIHRLGAHPRVAQVLMASGSPFPLGHSYFHPIYAAASEYDLPVAIHPGLEGVGIAGSGGTAGLVANYLEWHTLLATSYMTQLVSLVVEGVFEKYPKLKFVFVEGGVAWLPAMMWRLDKNWKALRSTTPWLRRKPSEIIQDHIWLTTQPIDEPDDIGHFRQILRMFDAEKMLMFSSDYPHWDGDTPDFALRQLDPSMRDAVMYGNALEVFNIQVPQHVG